MTDSISKDERLKMNTAPRDGRVIIVGSDDVGEFAMAWDGGAVNGLIPDVTGFWVAPDNSLTWDASGEFGPEYWRPLND